jgi:ABC-type multidrug transport system permease subunit
MSISKFEGEKEKVLDFKKISAIVQKNFIVMTRDRVRLLPLILFPVLMILIFGYTSGNIPKHISTAVVPYDNSFMSQAIQQEIANNQVFSVRYVVGTEGEAKKLLDSGKVRVIIEIPPNLEHDINNAVPTGITVIVDESDASVAATSKQTLNAIVNKIAAGMSLQKITGLQQSVGAAAAKLQTYTSQQINQYGQIASATVSGESALAKARGLTDGLANNLIDSLMLPTLIIPSISSDKDRYMTANNTFVSEPAGSAQIKAEIAILRQSGSLIGAAAGNVHAASVMAKQQDANVRSLQDAQAFNQNVLDPIRAIQVFTRYDANSILRPLIYEEKPAYGTGKRAIDFLIPSIIALTIFQGAVMGMGRAIAGEKREGSLTRVFLTPTSNATIIIGTLLFYILFEMFRSTFLIIVSMVFFHISIEGSLLAIGLILIIYAGVSTAMGMILSSMVRTEQQFMAMAMLISMPSLFLSGVLFPLQAMPKVMQILAQFLPVTYAGEALRGVMIKGFSVGMIAYPLFILFVFLVFAVALVFTVFKREIE